MIALARDGLSAKESKLLRSFDIKFQDDLSGYRDFISQLLMNSMDVAPKGEVEINQFEIIVSNLLGSNKSYVERNLSNE